MQNWSTHPPPNFKDLCQNPPFGTRLWRWAQVHLLWHPSQGQACRHEKMPTSVSITWITPTWDSADKYCCTERFPAKWKMSAWTGCGKVSQQISWPRFWWSLGDCRSLSGLAWIKYHCPLLWGHVRCAHDLNQILISLASLAHSTT